MTYNFKQTYEKSKVWSQWFVLLMNHKKIRFHLIMFFINSQRVKKSFFLYEWLVIWSNVDIFEKRFEDIMDLFCKGFKFHLFLWIILNFLSKITYFICISHIVKSFLRIGFDMFLMISSPFFSIQKGRNDFHGNSFFLHEKLFILYILELYILYLHEKQKCDSEILIL